MKGEEAGFWLTRQQRRRIDAWGKRTPLAPTIATAKPKTRVAFLPTAACRPRAARGG